jgi:GDPmannose 4,6-dehydratase
VADWLERCFRAVGREWRDHVRIRDGFVPEYRRLVSDPSTLRSLGWAPTVPLDALVAMMMRSPA